MEENISIQELYQVLKKRIVFILSITLIAVIISAIVTFFILTPKYEASTQILVNQSQNGNEEISSTDLQSSRELVSTYNIIMTSPAILEPVIEETNFDGSTSDLQAKINVESEEESQVATVTVNDTNPQKAVLLANTLAQTFENEIPNIMDVDNVSVLSEALSEDTNAPVSPQPILNLGIALIIGLIVAVSLAFVLEFLDKSIKSEQDIEKNLKLPILGTVPIMPENEVNNSLNNKTNSRSNIREKDRKTS
ncbi:YveK family protein [Marinococcus halophilus]|uniref:Capsular polysaccharide biosynthesis protein n=1 Tax=Marinococcus halophilus TaxID=1371 RepID=A0A510Y2Z8_MARHA|nr:Wzz/FepE/Etk N-terminal domain-containing protein [Marinococcus halophilus]GEK57696.1 capsular polysaccharide biosynthesis protein [Marinococcus halophilus]